MSEPRATAVGDEPAAPEPMPANVVAALARIQAELGGIPKLTSAQRGRSGEGVSYAYRGVDDIASRCQPLFGLYGIVVVPNVLEREVREVTVGGKPWTDTLTRVRWDVYGPGGRDDRIEAVTEGWGRDNADKGVNKAMTGAFKNLLLRLLCIGDPADDTDGVTHEADGGRRSSRQQRGRSEPSPEAEPPADPEIVARARTAYDELRGLDEPSRHEMRTWAGPERKLSIAAMIADPTWLGHVEAWLDERRASAAPRGDGE